LITLANLSYFPIILDCVHDLIKFFLASYFLIIVSNKPLSSCFIVTDSEYLHSSPHIGIL